MGNFLIEHNRNFDWGLDSAQRIYRLAFLQESENLDSAPLLISG